MASRLDYWFVPSRILPQIISCRIQEAIQTDHKAVIWQVQSPLMQVKGPGIWRLNDTFLKEKEFREGATSLIERRKQHSGGNAINDWTNIKTHIVQYARKYGREKAKKLTQQKAMVEQNLNELLEQYDPLTWTQEHQNRADKMKREMEAFYSNAEKNSKYFFGLEQQKNNNLGINAIYNEKNEVEKKPEAINEVLSGFWGGLYSSKQSERKREIMTEFLEELPQLPENQKELLEQPISLLECKEALFSMTDGKAPGEDGLTAAFYKTFWNELQNIFLALINGVYNAEIPESQEY